MRAVRPKPAKLFGAMLAATAAALALLATGVVGFGGSAHPASPSVWHTYTSGAGAFTVSYPAGWHRASKRLVPWLRDPGEILSLGTSALPVGAGGNCGRYPAAALVRLGPHDRLITLQRSSPSAGPHARWFRHLPRWPREFQLRDPAPFTIRDGAKGPTRHLWTYVLSLRSGGSYHWVFVAFGSHPSQPGVRQVERILGSVRFESPTGDGPGRTIG